MPNDTHFSGQKACLHDKKFCLLNGYTCSINLTGSIFLIFTTEEVAKLIGQKDCFCDKFRRLKGKGLNGYTVSIGYTGSINHCKAQIFGTEEVPKSLLLVK